MTDTNTAEREALQEYLKDCDAHAIVPDVGGAWRAAFQAGRASLAASAGGEPVAWQYRRLPDVGGVWFECSKERADQRAAHPERWEVRPLYAAPPTAQAEGWRLVPVEPTTDQEWAGKQAALRGPTMAEACKIYKAMLAAAPAPPTSAEGVEP